MKHVAVQFSYPIVKATRAGVVVTGSAYLRSLCSNVFFTSVPSDRAAFGAHSDVNPHAGLPSLHTSNKLHPRFGATGSFPSATLGTSQVVEDRIDHFKKVIMNPPLASDWTMADTGTTAPIGTEASSFAVKPSPVMVTDVTNDGMKTETDPSLVAGNIRSMGGPIDGCL